MESDARPSFINIARIVRTRGNRGEVLAELHTDFPERFHDLKTVWLERPGRDRQERILREAWEHKGRIVLKFEGVDSISEAEALTGSWVIVAAEAAVALPEGTYFDHQLVGCRVIDGAGVALGEVVEVLRIAGNHQLVVAAEGWEFLVPAVDRICRQVDVGNRQIVVDLPDGIVDLNR